MVKIIVAIEIPDMDYDELRKKVIKDGLWDYPNGREIGVPRKYLEGESEKYFRCELIGVRP